MDGYSIFLLVSFTINFNFNLYYQLTIINHERKRSIIAENKKCNILPEMLLSHFQSGK